MAESSGDTSRRRSIMVGALVLAVVVAAGAFFWLRGAPTGSKKEAEQPSAEPIGIVNVARAMEAHPLREKLVALYGERDELRMMVDFDRVMLVKLTAPKAAKEPFDDAVRQKEKQHDIKNHGEMLEKLAAAEKADREATKKDFEAARDEINGEYFNEIFNIQMKLDNAEAMKLSNDTIKELAARLHELQRERGARQYELWRTHENEIKARSEARAKEMGIELDELRARTTEEIAAEEMRKKAEADRRNFDAMQKNMMERIATRQKLVEHQMDLSSKQQEIRSMEQAMMADVRAKAMKLAVAHHLSAVFAAPARSIGSIVHDAFPYGARAKEKAVVTGGTAIDLTDELTAEMKNK